MTDSKGGTYAMRLFPEVRPDRGFDFAEREASPNNTLIRIDTLCISLWNAEPHKDLASSSLDRWGCAIPHFSNSFNSQRDIKETKRCQRDIKEMSGSSPTRAPEPDSNLLGLG